MGIFNRRNPIKDEVPRKDLRGQCHLMFFNPPKSKYPESMLYLKKQDADRIMKEYGERGARVSLNMISVTWYGTIDTRTIIWE